MTLEPTTPTSGHRALRCGAILACGSMLLLCAAVWLPACSRPDAAPAPPSPGLAAATPPAETSTVWLGGRGGPRQVLEVLDLEVPPATITVGLYREHGAGASGGIESWHRVEDLSTAGPDDKVFTVEPRAGSTTLIHFGDGAHGAVPRAGDRVFRIRFVGGQRGSGGGAAVRHALARD